MQRAFKDLLISLPGGFALPPPLGHVFRFHIRQGDAELIVQFVAQMTFRRCKNSLNFPKPFSCIRIIRRRQGVYRGFNLVT